MNPFCPGVIALGQAPRPHDQLWHHPPMTVAQGRLWCTVCRLYAPVGWPSMHECPHCREAGRSGVVQWIAPADKRAGGADGHGLQVQAAEAAQGEASVTASPRSCFIRAQRDAALDAYDAKVITDRDRQWLLYVYDHMEAYP